MRYLLESDAADHGYDAYLEFEIESHVERGDQCCPSWIDSMLARLVTVHLFDGESRPATEAEAVEVGKWFDRWMDQTAEGRDVRDRIEDRIYEGAGR